MPEGDGLGRLQVGEARHHGAGVPQRRLGQRPLQVGGPGVEPVEGVAHPQPHVGGDLIVARARGVEPPRGRADDLGEAALHRHVDVLELALVDEGPTLDLVADALEPRLDRGHILGRKDALLPEHRDVRQRAADVLGGEALVEPDGGVDLLHDLGGAAREAPAPHPVAHV